MPRVYDELVSFVLKPENIESALDLVDVVPRAIDELHIKFWKKLKEIIEQGLGERGVANKFSVKGRPADPEDFIEGDGTLELTSVQTTDMPLFWAYWVEQDYDPRARSRSEKKLAPIWCGLGFTGQARRMKQQAASLPTWAKQLHDQLGVDWIRDPDPGEWCYVVHAEPAKLRARSEIIRLAQGDDLEQEVAKLLFDLFDKTHKDLESENRMLSSP